jgi:hypothetical protein
LAGLQLSAEGTILLLIIQLTIMYLVTSDNENFLRVFDKEIAERLAENIGGIVIENKN